MDFTGLRGLDLGCSVGGITFRLQQAGARMLAFDADPAAIAVALEAERTHRTGARFQHRNLGMGRLDCIEFDFAICFSVLPWISREHGWDAAQRFMAEVREAAPILWFECQQGPHDGEAGAFVPFRGPDDVAAFLRTLYGTVEATGPADDWCGGREVFLCRA